jgi:nucleotide-binding universal stress UspA family protein
MNTIVVAYNDTDSSARALDRAAELAGFYGAKLVVTSVVPVLVGGERPPATGPELEHAQRNLRELGLEAELVEAVGEIAEAIVEVAERSSADLIVVGTRELSQVERLLGHSVSEGVQRMAHCDVLIVH